MTDTSFGALLRRLRGDRPQKDVATELGMPVTTLSSLEKQVGVPRGPMLKRLANFYGVPVTYFYAGPSGQAGPSAEARTWLASLRNSMSAKPAVATYADPAISAELKAAVGEALHKHAATADNE